MRISRSCIILRIIRYCHSHPYGNGIIRYYSKGNEIGANFVRDKLVGFLKRYRNIGQYCLSQYYGQMYNSQCIARISYHFYVNSNTSFLTLEESNCITANSITLFHRLDGIFPLAEECENFE